jgi:MoxR-like ATPase
MIGFVQELRRDNRLDKKPSVRATLGLYERSQAHALLRNKKEVGMEDLQSVVVSVLAHRISVRPSIKYSTNPAELVKQVFADFSHESSEEKGDVP